MSEAMTARAPAEELNRLTKAASEALTDSMIERLGATGANLLEVADRLNNEETRDAIHTVLRRLTELHRTGALNTLFDVVVLLHAVREASTDNIIERLFVFVETMANTFASEDMAALADSTRTALQQASAQSAGVQERGGLFAALSLLSKPESQRSLQFLLNFGANLQRQCGKKT